MQNDNKKINNASSAENTSIKSKAKVNSPKAEKQKNTIGAKSKYFKPRSSKAKSPKSDTEKTTMVAPKKIKLLFTIVNRQKTEFFVDLLQNFEVNVQLVLTAQGTASEHIVSLLGLADSDKSVIISVIRQDKIKDALSALEEKFNTVKGGKV